MEKPVVNIDYSKLSADYDKMGEGGKKKKGRDGELKLEVGTTRVRIVPWLGGRIPYAEHCTHYLKTAEGRRPVTCLRTPGVDGKCVACKASFKLKDAAEAASKELANKIRQQRSWLYNVVVRGRENEGVLLLRAGAKTHEGILANAKDTVNNPDFFHPQKGFDVLIERRGLTKNDTVYLVRLVANRLPIGLTPAQTEEFLQSAKDLSKLALSDVPTPEALREMVKASLVPEDADDDVDSLIAGIGQTPTGPTYEVPAGFEAPAEAAASSSILPPAEEEGVEIPADDVEEVEAPASVSTAIPPAAPTVTEAPAPAAAAPAAAPSSAKAAAMAQLEKLKNMRERSRVATK